MSDATARAADLRARLDYDGAGLPETGQSASPLAQVQQWVAEAQQRQEEHGDVPEPLALSVATVAADGVPDVRTVLMRFLDGRGPGFVTGTTSAKARQLVANPGIAASLTWASMFRAVRFRGLAEPLDEEEVREYWAQRPYGSRISAWASRQSEPATGREELERAYAAYAERWPDTGAPEDIPVPGHWGGYRVRCTSLELWSGRRDRLHDRLRADPVEPGSASSALDDAAAWVWTRLQP